MASRTLPGLGLQGFWTLGEAWKTGGDTNWLALSVMAQIVVESATTTLPAAPANGVMYIVPQSASSNKGSVAVRDAGAWVYFVPPLGAQAWVKDAVGVDKRYRFDGTTWVAEHTPVREKLTAARTYFVRTDGNDANTGLANTAAAAFRTIQKAVDTAASLDNGNFDITITVQAGTWTDGAELKETVGGGYVIIDGGSSASCTISTTDRSCFFAPASTRASKYRLQNMRLQTSGASGYAIAAYNGPTNIEFQFITFGATAGAQIFASQQGNIQAIGNYSILGGGVAHVIASEYGVFAVKQGITITLAGTPAYTTGFVASVRTGFVSIYSVTITGAATGPRYTANNGGGIFTAGAGASFLPGSIAGTATAPGWYA